jgi:endonuclease VIII
MPEGPEIKRAADKIAAAIVPYPVEEVWFAFDHLKGYESALKDRMVTALEPRGKALLTRFDNGLNIYSHNQLYGKWVICKARSYPQTSRQLRLAIHNMRKSALLYSASDIEVIADDMLAHHPFLNRIGPDVLSDWISIDIVKQRLNDPAFRRRRLTTLLLGSTLPGRTRQLFTERNPVCGKGASVPTPSGLHNRTNRGFG